MKRFPEKPAMMTAKGNAQAAFIAVTIGNLERLDAGLISRTTGVPISDVQAMIDARREKEATRAVG